ncbi:unnamed protein product [Citrullus colocynthis]|uniref:Uncharacterized protein n=1 Tax=Citrullus colocynthis TaxID=252529 RepID=A0ABP0XUR4_9ROSI
MPPLRKTQIPPSATSVVRSSFQRSKEFEKIGMEFLPAVLGEEDLRWYSIALRKLVTELISGSRAREHRISEASTERNGETQRHFIPFFFLSLHFRLYICFLSSPWFSQNAIAVILFLATVLCCYGQNDF